jgi:hypothetical protein
MNTWVSFNLYVATGVLIEGCHSPETSQESQSNLDFLLTALQAIGRKHIVTQAFMAQLKIDLEIAGISNLFGEIDVSHTKDHLHSSMLIYTQKRKNVFTMGAPAIDARSFKNRVAEFSADVLNQSIFSTGISRTVNGTSESCGTSDKDSATPPQDPHSTPDMLGILPKKSMTERLRRANNIIPFKISNQYEQNMGYDVPKTFDMPSFLAQYPVQGEPEIVPQQKLQAEDISTTSDSQLSSFPSPFPGQQQFIQTGNNRNIVQNPHGSYTSTTNDSMPSGWAFGPMENSVLGGFSGFEFPLQEGDINAFLNGASWQGSAF